MLGLLSAILNIGDIRFGEDEGSSAFIENLEILDKGELVVANAKEFSEMCL